MFSENFALLRQSVSLSLETILRDEIQFQRATANPRA